MKGYNFRLGDMGHAECQKCGGVFLHVYGLSAPDHICPRYECGRIIRCGMDERMDIATDAVKLDSDGWPG